MLLRLPERYYLVASIELTVFGDTNEWDSTDLAVATSLTVVAISFRRCIIPKIVLNIPINMVPIPGGKVRMRPRVFLNAVIVSVPQVWS